MKKTLTIRLSNGLGNQMFMYASSLAIAVETNRKLLIDDETAFLSRKNISKYSLDIFALNNNIAPKNFKFKNFYGYLKRKILIKLDKFKRNNLFYIEKKDSSKISKFQKDLFKESPLDNIFLEGHLETEKYFQNIRSTILNEFKFNKIELFKKKKIFKIINNKNIVAICLRQNRFTEGKTSKIDIQKKNSDIFLNEQIDYINKAIKYFLNTLENPKFFLWANDVDKINTSKFIHNLTKVNNKHEFPDQKDVVAFDLFLLTQIPNHIVIPSSFNWWGAWLNNSPNKCILRPSQSFFSKFRINNLDLWPSEWIEIKK